jgi:hypothetical protein
VIVVAGPIRDERRINAANIMETGETAFLTTLAVKRKFIRALFSSTQRCAEE